MGLGPRYRYGSGMGMEMEMEMGMHSPVTIYHVHRIVSISEHSSFLFTQTHLGAACLFSNFLPASLPACWPFYFIYSKSEFFAGGFGT